MRVPIRKGGKYTNQEADHHVTAEKLKELKDKLHHLETISMPRAAAEANRLAQNGDYSENAEYQIAKGRLRGINQRILELTEYLKHAVVITPGASDRVRIGHTVTVQMSGQERRYQILGSTETDPAAGVISHLSPLGQALLGRRVGDVVEIKLSKGTTNSLTITAIK